MYRANHLVDLSSACAWKTDLRIMEPTGTNPNSIKMVKFPQSKNEAGETVGACGRISMP
jgi:hypothetical protein